LFAEGRQEGRGQAGIGLQDCREEAGQEVVQTRTRRPRRLRQPGIPALSGAGQCPATSQTQGT
jgi:hypothetical protein